jgi:hypothetical protein
VGRLIEGSVPNTHPGRSALDERRLRWFKRAGAPFAFSKLQT